MFSIRRNRPLAWTQSWDVPSDVDPGFDAAIKSLFFIIFQQYNHKLKIQFYIVWGSVQRDINQSKNIMHNMTIKIILKQDIIQQ